MRFSIFVLAAVAAASPQFPVPKGDGTYGSGRYPAYYSEHPGLKGHTIYSPKAQIAEKMPVILWGNGMCSDQGLGFRNFLTEVASHGYYIIANGEPKGKGQASNQKMVDALNWIDKVAGTGNLTNVDKNKIGAAGQSCGGWQAYRVSTDKRIKLTGIFDSGGNMGGKGAGAGAGFSLKQLHAPVGYFLGGTSDMAYRPGTQDYQNLPPSIPAVLVNNPKGGHMQDFMTKQGGLVAFAGRSFFDWILKNSTEGREVLLSKSSRLAKAGWQVQNKGFKI